MLLLSISKIFMYNLIMVIQKFQNLKKKKKKRKRKATKKQKQINKTKNQQQTYVFFNVFVVEM